MISKNYFVIFFSLVNLFVSSLCAVDKVYILEGDKSKYGIVADNDEWICSSSVKKDSSTTLFESGIAVIRGKNKMLPVTFILTADSKHPKSAKQAMDAAQDFLLKYARKTNTVFSDVGFKEDRKTSFVVDGSYFDNVSSGYFAIYFQVSKPYVYNMFIQIQDETMKKEMRDPIFDKTFSLLQPLYSQKEPTPVKSFSR